MPTINDIARLAGVAKSTVSRYLNGGSVSHATRQKLDRIMRETGYQPNVFAQSLKAKQTGLIGVIIPRIGSAATNDVLKAIDQRAREENKQILIVTTEQMVERELAALQTLARQKVDGIILIATSVTDAHEAVLHTIQTPVLFVGQRCSDSSLGRCLIYDDEAAGRLMAEHAYQLGHRHVVYFGVGAYDEAVGINRRKGVQSFFAEAAESVTLELVETSFQATDAYQQTLSFLPQTNATFLMAATDNIASGLLKAALELGYRVPEDVNIAGFGGYQISDVMSPSLTTVVYPYAAAGAQSLTLLAQMTVRSVPHTTLLQPLGLIAKQSTCWRQQMSR